MAAGRRIAELLWDAPGTSLAVELAAWIERAAAPGGPTIFDYDLPMSDWAFARGVWDLARLVERDRRVPPGAVRAAIAVIEHVSRLPTSEDAEAMRRAMEKSPWPVVRSPAARAAVTYAIQILAASHTTDARRAIESMRFDRSGRAAPLEIHYQDPTKDHLVRLDNGLEIADVDAWFRWSLARLADVPP